LEQAYYCEQEESAKAARLKLTGLRNTRGGSTEGDQVLAVSRGTAHTQETVFETPAFQVIIEVALHIARQYPALRRQMHHECRVILIDDPVEQRMLGPMALLTTNARTGSSVPCCSMVRNESRPCDAVQAYSVLWDHHP
jgi:hypothetical protein